MKMIKTFKGAIVALTLLAGSAQADLLETHYDADNFSFGNMFDINVLENLSITGFDLNLGDNSQNDAPIENFVIFPEGGDTGKVFDDIFIYIKLDDSWDINEDGTAGTTTGTTAENYATDPRNITEWEQIAHLEDVVSAGGNLATYVNIEDYYLSEGSHSLWITSASGIQQINYANSTAAVGDVLSSDDNLEILVGAGLRFSAENNNLFTPREFTGAIHYQVPEPSTLSLFGLALIGLAFGRKKLKV